jgi:hypothetical protein
MGKNVKGSDPILFYVIISTFCLRALELYQNIWFSEGDLNLITAKSKACDFELLCHDINFYFDEINFV